MSESTVSFEKRYRIEATLICETGLHIGGSESDFQIGAEKPVIKDIRTDEPYIPGSSLKGKVRSLLERRLCKKYKKGPGKNRKNLLNCSHRSECKYGICRVFGLPASKDGASVGPTRLIVRDAFLSNAEELESLLGTGVYTELKSENTINPVSGVAKPRTVERVPRGAEFKVTMIYNHYSEDELCWLKSVFRGLSELEQDYLGGGGSRGSGRVQVFINCVEVSCIDEKETIGKLRGPVKKLVVEFDELIDKKGGKSDES